MLIYLFIIIIFFNQTHLVKGCWWVWIFDSLGFFGGGCDCVEGYWWWWLWLWISGFAIGGGGVGFEDTDSNHILLCSVSGWVHYFGKK